MKTKSIYKLTLSIPEMEHLISKMKKEIEHNECMSESVMVSLCSDTDKKTLVIDNTESAYLFSSYAECNGTYFKI